MNKSLKFEFFQKKPQQIDFAWNSQEVNDIVTHNAGSISMKTSLVKAVANHIQS